MKPNQLPGYGGRRRRIEGRPASPARAHNAHGCHHGQPHPGAGHRSCRLGAHRQRRGGASRQRCQANPWTSRR